MLDEFNDKYNIHKFYGTFEQMKDFTQIYDKIFCGSDDERGFLECGKALVYARIW